MFELEIEIEKREGNRKPNLAQQPKNQISKTQNPAKPQIPAQTKPRPGPLSFPPRTARAAQLSPCQRRGPLGPLPPARLRSALTQRARTAGPHPARLAHGGPLHATHRPSRAHPSASRRLTPAERAPRSPDPVAADCLGPPARSVLLLPQRPAAIPGVISPAFHPGRARTGWPPPYK